MLSKKGGAIVKFILRTYIPACNEFVYDTIEEARKELEQNKLLFPENHFKIVITESTLNGEELS